MKNQINFPKPSGNYIVGYFDDYVKYQCEYGERSLGFRCFYPADSKTKKQMTYIDENMYKMFEDLAPSSPICGLYKKYINLKTNSYKGANIDKSKHRVIIYSPGYNSVPWANLVQIEELVSNGYIVFAVARGGESFCTILGDKMLSRHVELFGPFVEEVIKYMMESEGYSPDPMFVYEWSVEGIKKYLDKCAVAAKRMELWSNDITQVINYVQEKSVDVNHILNDKVADDKFGAFGNSFGGSASIYAGLVDNRIGACINLDGWIYGGKLLEKKLEIPALNFSKSINHYLASYGTENSNILSLVVNNTVNEFMSDCCVINEEYTRNVSKYESLIDGKLMSDILTDYIIDFFDIHLKNKKIDMSENNDKYLNNVKLTKFGVN